MARGDAATPARERWNERYAGGAFAAFPGTPAEWLVEHRALLAELSDGREARALDVACGDGRDARYLAELGFAVDALDVSDVAVAALRAAAAERGLRVDAQVRDLERDPPPPARYDVVVCMNYLQRDLFAALATALRPGGVLLY
jgi:tellurite methyltransferase